MMVKVISIEEMYPVSDDAMYKADPVYSVNMAWNKDWLICAHCWSGHIGNS